MHKVYKFIYLNTYSFLLLFCGIIFAALPLYKITFLLIIPQVIICLLFIKYSLQLFYTWKDKKRKYRILIEKNQNGFRPDSFKIFMQAPCGRLLSKTVLKELGMEEHYKTLSILYKEPFLETFKNGCTKQKTKIYIKENQNIKEIVL